MAVATEGGGSDRNSLSIKQTERWREADTVNQRDNEPQIEEKGGRGGVAPKALTICDEELEEQ